MGKMEKFDILNVKISAVNINEVCAAIEDLIRRKGREYICVCPVSTIMECQADTKVLESVNASFLATPDGMPVVWLGKLKGYKNINRVYGPDLLLRMCQISEEKGYRNYFYGSTPEVLEKLLDNLRKMFPGLAISGAYSPPFRSLIEEEDKKNIEMLNAADSDIIWVGLGSPKQDIWMSQHRGLLNSTVMIGVGAAFDFIAGIKKQAPFWMQKSGLEWFFRLINEPARLWKRYLVGNSVFLCLICRDFILGKFRRRKEELDER
jgi:N-acetylglucosaminyldiphosphoundecaprenol N-acetyl-beta-D-mannosaminyltransferase